jgi:hypothetical protein
MAKKTPFNLNYKNINTITSLACESLQPIKSFNKILRSKILINKVKLNQNSKKVKFELTGHCNSIFSKSTNELIQLGDEINMTANLSRNNISFHGQIGLNQVKLFFKNGYPTKLTMFNEFSNERTKYNLKRSSWADSDSLFTIGSSSSIRINLNKNKKIREKDLTLVFSKKHFHYNIWSFNSFGCASKTSISKKQCESLGKDS